MTLWTYISLDNKTGKINKRCCNFPRGTKTSYYLSRYKKYEVSKCEIVLIDEMQIKSGQEYEIILDSKVTEEPIAKEQLPVHGNANAEVNWDDFLALEPEPNRSKNEQNIEIQTMSNAN